MYRINHINHVRQFDHTPRLHEKDCGRLMVSAAGSGHGKSVVTMGLLEALKERGICLQSFKCGPDYIDPGFHERVLGIPCRNLDTFLMGAEDVCEEVSAAEGRGCLCIAEGAMGLMDGLGGTSEHSAYSIARLCDMKVLAVLDAGRSDTAQNAATISEARQTDRAQKTAAISDTGRSDTGRSDTGRSDTAQSIVTTSDLCLRQLEKLLEKDAEGLIRGVLINRCRSEEYGSVAKRLRETSGVCVCGYLPPMDEARFPSRHLGLVGAKETEDFSKRVHKIAQELEKNGTVEQVLSLLNDNREDSFAPQDNRCLEQQTCESPAPQSSEDAVYQTETLCRIAAARDEAFAFFYQKSLENLERAGASLCFFSPLHDECLPRGVHGLYLPGGYPELYAPGLENNTSMRKSVHDAIQNEMPVIAECGGFLYLGKYLCAEDGKPFEMTGVFEGTASSQKKLVRFGYLEIVQDRGDSLLLYEGERMTAHEFHYWDSTQNGEELLAVKRSRNREWRFGFATPTMYAGFPHIYLDHIRAERFVRACVNYRESREADWMQQADYLEDDLVLFGGRHESG